MDVHTTNFTLSAFEFGSEKVFAQTTVEPDYLEVMKYINKLKDRYNKDAEYICGYEAGYLGYSLYNSLTKAGIKCIIMAPSTMPALNGKNIKTDRRDSDNIARCLAYGTYSEVHVPTPKDDAVKEYIRMRDDHKSSLKRIKQQILALCSRHDKHYYKQSYWTVEHINWLKKITFDEPILMETLEEYLTSYNKAAETIERMDRRIEEISLSEEYRDDVKKIASFSGISYHTALALRVEISDFNRFGNANNFASFLGLVPREHSSSDSVNRGSITKAGNSHLRSLLVEAAQCYTRGKYGSKSKALKARQKDVPQECITYADRAVNRLKKKYKRLSSRMNHNVAKTAVARELSCFVWGMMTGNID